MNDNPIENKVDAAAQAAAEANKATSEARAAMFKDFKEELIGTVSKEMKEAFAFAFTTPDGLQRKFVDMTQLNRVCDDIEGMHTSLSTLKDNQKDIKNDLSWIKYIGGGFVIAAGLLALKSLGV